MAKNESIISVKVRKTYLKLLNYKSRVLCGNTNFGSMPMSKHIDGICLCSILEGDMTPYDKECELCLLLYKKQKGNKNGKNRNKKK